MGVQRRKCSGDVAVVFYHTLEAVDVNRCINPSGNFVNADFITIEQIVLVMNTAVEHKWVYFREDQDRMHMAQGVHL
jgi:hypothetical protein